MIKFSRNIKFSYPKLEFKLNIDLLKKRIFNNCHFGSLKLTYCEIEFLVYCSRYININDCLIVYIGA
jgi:hypothetical protein